MAVTARVPLMTTLFKAALSMSTVCKASSLGPAMLISSGSATPSNTRDAFTRIVVSVVPSNGVGGTVGVPDGAAVGAHVPEPNADIPCAAWFSEKQRHEPCDSSGFRATPLGTQTPVQSSYNTSSS